MGGRTNVHDEEQRGRPSLVSDDLVQNVDQKMYERRHFTISELSYEITQISGTVLYEVIAVRLGCHKLCARWVPIMLMGEHKTQRIAWAFDFFRAIPQRWCEFLSHIARIRGDKTWVSFVNVETREQSKQWMHTFITQVKKVETNSACQKADGNCFLGEEKSSGVGINATRDKSNVRNVLRNTKNYVGPFRKKEWNADIRCVAPP
jgi:hypothetical protein